MERRAEHIRVAENAIETARIGILQLGEAILDCLLEDILNGGERVVVVGTGVGQNRGPRGDFNQGACTLKPR